MKEINSDILKKWSDGEEIDDSPYFIMVKTKSCGKCSSLLERENIFRKPEWFNTYTFTPQDATGAEILQKVGITSVPFILFRYKIRKGTFFKYQLGYIIPDFDEGFINFENIIDAIYDRDFSFFGFNELDEQIEKDSENNYEISRLLHEIYGEVNEEVLSERNTFKDSITN
jgi:hypothetical protein